MATQKKKFGRATSQEVTNFGFGQYGSEYTESTNTIGSEETEYCAIRFWSPSVVASIVDVDGQAHWSDGKTFARGDVLYGRFKTATLTSGSMECFSAIQEG